MHFAIDRSSTYRTWGLLALLEGIIFRSLPSSDNRLHCEPRISLLLSLISSCHRGFKRSREWHSPALGCLDFCQRVAPIQSKPSMSGEVQYL